MNATEQVICEYVGIPPTFIISRFYLNISLRIFAMVILHFNISTNKHEYIYSSNKGFLTRSYIKRRNLHNALNYLIYIVTHPSKFMP